MCELSAQQSQRAVFIGHEIREVVNGLFETFSTHDSNIWIDNKYYSAEIQCLVFDTSEQFLNSFNHEDIGIIVLRLSDPKSMTSILSNIDPHSSQVIFIRDADSDDKIDSFDCDIPIETVSLNPSEEEKSLAAEYSEKMGLDRIKELFEVFDWPFKQIKAASSVSEISQSVAEVSGQPATGTSSSSVTSDGTVNGPTDETLDELASIMLSMRQTIVNMDFGDTSRLDAAEDFISQLLATNGEDEECSDSDNS